MRDIPSGTMRDIPSGTMRDIPSGTMTDMLLNHETIKYCMTCIDNYLKNNNCIKNVIKVRSKDRVKTVKQLEVNN
jgi:hypothetical protein